MTTTPGPPPAARGVRRSHVRPPPSHRPPPPPDGTRGGPPVRPVGRSSRWRPRRPPSPGTRSRSTADPRPTSSRLTNRSRASAGLKALKVDSTLKSVARWRSKDMIDRDYFSHTIPGFGKVWDKLHDIGYCYKVAGENIGWNNYPDDIATAAIHSMFMDSPGHRANILGKTWDVDRDRCLQGPDRQEDVDGHLRRQVRHRTPAPTPKPTVKPKPKPTAKPDPKPTVKPAPKPSRDGRRRPPPTTPAPTPEPSPEAAPSRGRPSSPPSFDTIEPSEEPSTGDAQRGTGPTAPTATAPSRCAWSIGHVGRTARDDRRWRDRLLLRRLMMAIATRTPRPVAPGPVRPAPRPAPHRPHGGPGPGDPRGV